MSTDGASAVSADFRAVAAEVNKLGDRIDKAIKPQLVATEAAFRQLGMGGSKAFQELAKSAESDRIKAAFKTIQTSAFATGAEVDRAAKAMAASLRSLDAVAAQTATGFTSMRSAASSAFAVFTGVSLAGVFTAGLAAARSYAAELEKIGENTLKAERAFQSMTQAVGVNGDQLLARMKEVSRGLADQDDIMLSSSRALQQGLQPEQLVSLMGLATERAKIMGTTVAEAFNGMADAVATGNTRILRHANIMIDTDKVYKEFADRLQTIPEALNAGLRSQALFEAVMRESGRQAKGVTTALDENVDALERHRIAINNWKQEQGKILAQGKAQYVAYFDDIMMRGQKWIERLAEMRDAWARSGPLGFLAGPRTGTSFADDQPWNIPKAPLTGGATVEGPSAVAATLGAMRAQSEVAASAIEAAAARATIAVKEAVAQRVLTVEGGAVKEAAIVADAATKQLAVYQNLLSAFKGTAQERATIEARIIDLSVKAEQAASGARLAVWARADVDLKKFIETLNSGIDDDLARVTQGVDHYALALREAAEAQAKFSASMDVMMGALDGSADAFDAQSAALRQGVVQDWTKAENELAGLNATMGQTGPAADAMLLSFQITGKALDDIDPKLRAAIENYTRIKATLADTKGAEAYAESLAAIDRQAKLLGPDFDALSPTISSVTNEILRLGKAGQDVTALQEKLAGLKQVQELKSIFTDVFGSISSAINTSVQGVILGTTTMAKAWDNLWKSIVLSFVNSGIQRLLKGLQDWALDFVFGGSSGGSSGGGVLSKLFGGGSSSPSPTPDAASFDAGNFPDMDALSTSVSGTTSGLNQLSGLLKSSNFQAGVGALLSAVGVGMGVYGLTQGGSSGQMALSAGGTAISVYSLAVSISSILAKAGIISASSMLTPLSTMIGNAMMAIAPTLTAAINTALGTSIGVASGATGAAAGTGIGAGLISTLAESAGASFSVFAGMMVAGGFAGMQDDAEEAAQTFRETRGKLLSVSSSMELAANRFDNLTAALDAAHLPQTLAELKSALVSLPDLAHAVGVGATEITAMIPEWRAKFGAVLLATLDAANTQGLDTSETTQSPLRSITTPWAGAVGMQSFEDMLAQSGSIQDGFDKLTGLMEHVSQILDPEVFMVNATGVRMVDVAKLNKLLDGEQLTMVLRNAVVDVGRMLGLSSEQFAGAGLGDSAANWTMRPGASTGGGDWTGIMPSVAEIAQVQAALDAAGFVPGEYGKALEEFLISIDQNIVSHPMWAQFSAALKGATTAGGLADALMGLMAGPGTFNSAAAAIIGSLNAQIAAQVTARRQATDPEAAAAIDKVLEGLGAQLKAWNDGFKHLYASSVSVQALLPPDLAAQAKTALEPLWLGLVDTMQSGATEQATVAAQLFSEQLGAWGAFGVAIAEAVDVRALLPPDLAESVRAKLAPAYDAIIATLTEGNVALAMLQLEQFNKEVASYKALGQLINTIHVEVAGLTNEVGAIIAAWQMQAAQMDRAVARSKSVFEETLSSGDVQATADAALAYHTALLARLDAEVKAVRAYEAAMQALVDNYMVPLAARATQLAVSFLEMGDPARLTGLLTTLAEIAEVGQTAGVRLAAIGAGLRAIIAALPVAVQGTAEIPGLAGDQIPAAVTSAATPFLTQLDSLIADALLGGDTRGALDLLKEQASAFEALGQAGIAAVTQSAEQAKATQIAAIEKVRDAQLAAHAVAQQAIEAQLQAAQQWLSAVQGAEGFEQSLLLGAGSPLNQAQQLAMVKSQYEAARGAATSSPEALSAAIQAAQTYLSVLGRGQEPGKESAAFKAATAAILKDVRGFLSQTGSSGAIKGQITLLQQQLESMKAVGQAISDAADKQIEAAKKEIDAAAQAIITGIVTDLSEALDVNTKRQNELISSIFDSQLESMKAITGGRPGQEFLALKAKEGVDALLAIAYSVQRIQLGAALANPSAPIRPEAPDRPPDTPMPTEGARRSAPVVPVTRRPETPTSARAGGPQVLVIDELHVHSHLDGGQMTETVLKNVRVQVRAGAKDLLPAGAVAKR